MRGNEDESLQEYIEAHILPMYDGFDAAHRRDHALMVMEQSMALAQGHEVEQAMVLAIAAYHDTGLAAGRERHHLTSGEVVRGDRRLRRWFTEEQIETMAQAVEDHRASSGNEPRSIYGRIVAEADRYIDPPKIVERTVQFGLQHYPDLDREAHWQRTLAHLHEKYAEGGYLRLWFADSPNAARLEALRALIRDEARLREIFDHTYLLLTKEK